jgi:hypothetical protein
MGLASKSITTKGGQRLRCFRHSPNHHLADQINDFADEYNLMIDWVEFMESSSPRVAYVMYSKRKTGVCAECNGECPDSDYLCSKCRT